MSRARHGVTQHGVKRTFGALWAVCGMLVVLVFAATLDQVNLGIWAVQEKYFHSLFVLAKFGDLPVPVFPGGYLIGGLLLIALIVIGAGIATGFIDLQKTQEGRLPEVQVKQGALPKYEASIAKVEVGSRNETVEVPTVDVKKP